MFCFGALPDGTSPRGARATGKAVLLARDCTAPRGQRGIATKRSEKGIEPGSRDPEGNALAYSAVVATNFDVTLNL